MTKEDEQEEGERRREQEGLCSAFLLEGSKGRLTFPGC